VSKVYFVGCGPGDPDLVTIKAKKLIQKADVVVYSGSLIPPKIIKFCKKGKLYNAAKLVREEIFDLLKKNAKKNKVVVRLHDGDPTIYGAIREQIDNLRKVGIQSEIIPGVTSFLASAAVLETQLTLPGITQTIIITRAEKRTKVPKKEKISELAKHKATMIFYLSIHLLSKIVKESIQGGYSKSTPVAVVYRASWNDQKVITGTLNDITKKVWNEKITRTAIVIIGDVINPKTYEYSKLYDKTFSHGFRKAKSKKKLKN
jgi:precorrin-4/cobalt-precorrin-4 C11-methyltransferase